MAEERCCGPEQNPQLKVRTHASATPARPPPHPTTHTHSHTHTHTQHLDQLPHSRAQRREGALSKSSEVRVSNDALIVCEERLREHVYALIEGEEYDSVSRSW